MQGIPLVRFGYQQFTELPTNASRLIVKVYLFLYWTPEAVGHGLGGYVVCRAAQLR